MALTNGEAQSVQDLIIFLQGGTWPPEHEEGWQDQLRERASNALVMLSQRSARTLLAGQALEVDRARDLLGVLGNGLIAHVFPLPVTEWVAQDIETKLARGFEVGVAVVARQREVMRREVDPVWDPVRGLEECVRYLKADAADSLRLGYLGQARTAAAAAEKAEAIWVRAHDDAMAATRLAAVSATIDTNPTNLGSAVGGVTL